MKKKLSRNQLKKWLKKGANVALLSISLMGGANINFQMNNNITPQSFLSAVTIEDYPTGHYLVDYKYKKDCDEPDPLFCETVFGIYFDITLKSGGFVRHIDALESKLSEYSYIIVSDDRNIGYRLKSILVKKPDFPNELFELINTLNEHANFVSVYEDKTDLGAHAYINGKRASREAAKSFLDERDVIISS
jgi:hypothetical protein